MTLFVIAAGLMAAAHVVAALQRPRLAVIVSGILWALYAYYEHLIATGVLCDANCNIRVDLVLIFPILGLATFWAHQSYMGRPSHVKVIGSVLVVIGLVVFALGLADFGYGYLSVAVLCVLVVGVLYAIKSRFMTSRP
jgi:hypothetical protein